MKFGFLIHPLSEATKDLFRLDNGGALLEHWGGNLLELTSRLHRTLRETTPPAAQAEPTGPRLFDELTGLVSKKGPATEGRLYEIPMDAAAILADPDRAVAYMEKAVDEAASWGAEIVGLGSMTGIVGGHGSHLQERGPLAVTTGNSLTVYAAVHNLLNACAEADIDLRKETVAVVGIPGSVATACARLLKPRCRHLLLVGRQASPRSKRLASELDAQFSVDIPAALNKARIILSATSAGNCINQGWLLPGSIVIDVGVPADVKGTSAQRGDVLILSGGLSGVPETFARDSLFLKFFFGLVPSCLGETMVLALENRAECWSIGRDLDVERISQIGALAQNHGFDFAPLLSFGLPVEPGALAQFLKARTRFASPSKLVIAQKAKENGTPLRNGEAARAPATIANLAGRAATRYRRFINPVLGDLGRITGLVKTFVRGQGNELFDAEGRAYLDCVAGFGSVNLGHNHPAVVRAVQAALTQQAPGFTPAGINPLAAALAAKLVALAPTGLEMVFLCNSGTEAVEASLKLARAATGRTGLLHCDRSFHGKSFGSLSVTGNPVYQRPFGPLVPDCHSVPYGNEEALERALASRQIAAFIVEPIQGEGGMNVPPPGYLRAAQVLCRKAGTLLIADEVQTGLGRTGTMFAVDHDEIEPDMMALAKSLGGGLVPIGAMLVRRDLWLKAFGTAQTFALHSTTFGGGSLACAAALATLDVLAAEHLPQQAAALGHELYAGLDSIALRYPVVREVRGRGLLLGIEFEPPSDQILRHFRAMSGSDGMAWFVPQFDDNLRAMRTHYAMESLLQTHAIYTQTARSNPCVLRVQPPLTITPPEVRRILEAVETTCVELTAIKDLMETVVTKSIGEVEVRGRQPGSAAITGV